VNGDIRPRKRPLSTPPPLPNAPRAAASPAVPPPTPRPTATPPAATPNVAAAPVQPIALKPPQMLKTKPRKIKKTILWIAVSIVGVIILAIAGAFAWYQLALRPVNVQDQSRSRVQIVEGTSPTDIGQQLEEKGLIRSRYAFDIYTRLTGTRNKLQAGTYSLSPSESLQTITDHLVAGKVDTFNMTFLPGASLAENRAGLIKAGYSEAEVDAALSKTYDHPLFADKPAGTDLEGYIYGETYNFDSSATVEQILTKTFDEFQGVIAKNDLKAGFQKQGLNLYQGITLASIIQREVPGVADQKQVAQVFYTRLAAGMQLGSDVTYQYAAKKLGVAPSVDLESPYNTRKYVGLPPGPIATPGLAALQAVAMPAAGDYVYFLSGDDDTTYFSRTFEGHEANIRDHCKVKCATP